VACAAVVSGILTGGACLLAAFLRGQDFLQLASVAAAMALLGPAQLLRSASVLRRSASLCWKPEAQSYFLGLLAVALTAMVSALLALGFGAEEGESWAFGLALGIATQWKQLCRQHLIWDALPREAVQRRVKAQLPGILSSAIAFASLCMLVSAVLDGTSVFMSTWPRLLSGVVVLASADVHAELIEDCTSLPDSGLPSSDDMLEALTQPLACDGPGLGRWVALTALAQAIAYRNEGSYRETSAFSTATSRRGMDGQLPPFAADMFGYTGSQSASLVRATAPRTLPAGAVLDKLGTPSLGQRGLFRVYLESGLEVIREFTIRVQCLVATSWRRGPKALQASQLQVLEADMVELLPLMRVSVTGLASWICLSRDVDENGVVQREQALQKVIYELCGVLCAVEGVSQLQGILNLTPACGKAVRVAHEEARHSLDQLLLTFEGFGLSQVVMPPLYKQMLEGMGK